MNIWVLAKICAVTALSCSSALADEFKLADVRTDFLRNDKGEMLSASIRILTGSDGSITEFKYDSPEKKEPADQAHPDKWPVSDLKTGISPIDPKQTFGVRAITLKSSDFSPTNGGPVTLNYYRGAGARTGHLELQVDRDSTGWTLVLNDSSGRRKISTLIVYTRKLPPGITKIDAE